MLPLHSSLDCHYHADATSGSKLVSVHASSCHHCLLAYLFACACSFLSWFHFFHTFVWDVLAALHPQSLSIVLQCTSPWFTHVTSFNAHGRWHICIAGP